MTMESDIGIVNLPNQRHKIVAKRGATFTIMLCGESGLGKTTFINTLFSTAVKDYVDDSTRHSRPIRKTVEIGPTKAALEEKDFKVLLNIVDTPGFGDNVNNKDSWMPVIQFIDDQHEAYMMQERQPNRSDKIDRRVHACLYFIRPTGHSLKALDIEALRQLSSRVNVIPVIAKADTLAADEMMSFKERIRRQLKEQQIKVFVPTPDPDDDVEISKVQELVSAMPFSVIGSEKDVQNKDGNFVKGRHYLWGVAEVENENHCDFRKLRDLLIRTHMLDLIQTTEEVHYENFRTHALERAATGETKPSRAVNPKFREEEENLRKMFTEQIKLEEQRFRQWEVNLTQKRDALNKDLEETYSKLRQLEEETRELQSQLDQHRKR